MSKEQKGMKCFAQQVGGINRKEGHAETCDHSRCLGRCIPGEYCDPPVDPLSSSLHGVYGIAQCHRPAQDQTKRTPN